MAWGHRNMRSCVKGLRLPKSLRKSEDHCLGAGHVRDSTSTWGSVYSDLLLMRYTFYRYPPALGTEGLEEVYLIRDWSMLGPVVIM